MAEHKKVEMLILMAVGLPMGDGTEKRVAWKDPDAAKEEDERGVLGTEPMSPEEAERKARIENAKAKLSGSSRRYAAVPFLRDDGQIVHMPPALARRYAKSGIAVATEGITPDILADAKKITKEASVGS